METLSCNDRSTKGGWTILQEKTVEDRGGRCINGGQNNIRPINSKTRQSRPDEQCCRSFENPKLEELVKWQVSLLRATPLYPQSLQPERKIFSDHPNSPTCSESKPYSNIEGEIDGRAALIQGPETSRRKKLRVRRRSENLISSGDSQCLVSPPYVSIEDPLVVKYYSRMQQGTATHLPLSLHSDGSQGFTDSCKETIIDNRPNSHEMEFHKIGSDLISVRNPCDDVNEKKKKQQRLAVGGSLDVLVDAIGVLEKENNGQIDESFHCGWFGHAGVFFRQKIVTRRARSIYKQRLKLLPNSSTVLLNLPGTAEDEIVNINENQPHDEPYWQPSRIPSQPLIWSSRGRSRSLPAKYHDSVLVHPWKRGSRKNTSESLVRVH